MLRPIHIVFVCRKIKHPPRHETGPDRVGHFKRPKTYAFFPKRIFRLATGASLAKKNGKNGFNLKKIRMKVRNVKLLPASDASLSGFRSKICENVRKCVIFYALTENPTVACRKSCRNNERGISFDQNFCPQLTRHSPALHYKSPLITSAKRPKKARIFHKSDYEQKERYRFIPALCSIWL